MEKSEVKTQPTIQKDNEIILLFLDMYERGIKKNMRFGADAKDELTKLLKCDKIDNKNNTLKMIYDKLNKRNYVIDTKVKKFMLKK